MHLVWFVTIATLLLSILGEFGQIPFGSPMSVGLIDIGVISSVGLLMIWQVGITRKIIWQKWMWGLVAWWGVSLISIIFSGHWIGVLHWLRMVSYTSLVWLGMSLISTQVIKFETLIKWMLRMGVILLVAGIAQLIFLPDFTMLRDFGYDPHRFRLASTFLDPNFCGLILLSIGWWSFWMSRQLKNKYYLIVSVALFIGVIMTLSRTAYLAGLISAILIGWKLWRWKVVVGVLAVIIVGLMIPSIQVRLTGAFKMDVSASERFESWRNGITVWQQSPIFGVGYGNLRSALTELNLRKSYSADGGNAGAGLDSSLLVILASTGVVGLTVFLIWWIMIWRQLLLAGDKGYWLISLWIGWIAGGQFINAWFYPCLMLIFYLLAGAIIGGKKITKVGK